MDVLLNKCSMIRTRATVRYLKCRHCPTLLNASREEVNQKVAHSRAESGTVLLSSLYHPESVWHREPTKTHWFLYCWSPRAEGKLFSV